MALRRARSGRGRDRRGRRCAARRRRAPRRCRRPRAPSRCGRRSARFDCSMTMRRMAFPVIAARPGGGISVARGMPAWSYAWPPRVVNDRAMRAPGDFCRAASIRAFLRRRDSGRADRSGGDRGPDLRAVPRRPRAAARPGGALPGREPDHLGSGDAAAAEDPLVAFARRHPWTVGPLDAATSVLQPGGVLHAKVLTMAAILETSPAFADEFLPRSVSRARCSWQLVVGGAAASLAGARRARCCSPSPGAREMTDVIVVGSGPGGRATRRLVWSRRACGCSCSTSGIATSATRR